jgi:hypothetical protein
MDDSVSEVSLEETDVHATRLSLVREFATASIVEGGNPTIKATRLLLDFLFDLRLYASIFGEKEVTGEFYELSSDAPFRLELRVVRSEWSTVRHFSIALEAPHIRMGGVRETDNLLESVEVGRDGPAVKMSVRNINGDPILYCLHLLEPPSPASEAIYDFLVTESSKYVGSYARFRAEVAVKETSVDKRFHHWTGSTRDGGLVVYSRSFGEYIFRTR